MHPWIYQNPWELLGVYLCNSQPIIFQLAPSAGIYRNNIRVKRLQLWRRWSWSEPEPLGGCVCYFCRFQLAVEAPICSPTESLGIRSKRASREPPHSKCGSSWWTTLSSTSPAEIHREGKEEEISEGPKWERRQKNKTGFWDFFMLKRGRYIYF